VVERPHIQEALGMRQALFVAVAFSTPLQAQVAWWAAWLSSLPG
jgi:hypothetical protein